MNTKNKEQLSLDSAARHILEECRMVLPGIQALFGFQLIAVFNQGFEEKLSTVQQQLHLASIILTVFAVGLVMTPAALHRQIDPLAVSRQFIEWSTILLLLSMFPLGLSIPGTLHYRRDYHRIVLARLAGRRRSLGFIFCTVGASAKF